MILEGYYWARRIPRGKYPAARGWEPVCVFGGPVGGQRVKRIGIAYAEAIARFEIGARLGRVDQAEAAR